MTLTCVQSPSQSLVFNLLDAEALAEILAGLPRHLPAAAMSGLHSAMEDIKVEKAQMKMRPLVAAVAEHIGEDRERLCSMVMQLVEHVPEEKVRRSSQPTAITV